MTGLKLIVHSCPSLKINLRSDETLLQLPGGQQTRVLLNIRKRIVSGHFRIVPAVNITIQPQ
jgi:hypothetical protein